MTVDRIPPENFELLLSWLAPERDKAGEKYEQIRRNLHDYFRRRDVSDPLTLTDEVILRVTRKVDQVAPDYVGEPSAYFLAVARRVLAEWRRRPAETNLLGGIPVSTDSEGAERKERMLQSLEHCWARLSKSEQDFLLRYCIGIPPLKLAASRELLAQETNLSLNALRVTAHRLKRKVKICIESLMEDKNLK